MTVTHHKFLLICALVVANAPLRAESASPERPPLQPEIRLPSITSKWKRPGDKDLPEITLDELERCIGRDVGMQGELSEVKHAQRQLESERMELDKANDELKQSAMSIEAVRVNLKDQATRFQAEGASLDQRLSAIEKRKKSAPRDQADINAINALVGAYNADTARRNKWRISLLGSQDAFNKSLAAHNATVVELNEKVAVFNKHNNEFQRSAAALAKRSEQYMSSCTGEHVIRKSSAG
jgi:chromosome segregation ATPase